MAHSATSWQLVSTMAALYISSFCLSISLQMVSMMADLYLYSDWQAVTIF